MSVAALEAELLGACLGRGGHGLWRRFFAGAAKVIDSPERAARDRLLYGETQIAARLER